MNPGIVCLLLMLAAAYFAWRAWSAEKLLDELEDELFACKTALKHGRWRGTDRPVLRKEAL